MECKLCKIYENKELLNIMKIYEDEICIVLLSKKPASLCHTIIYPKKHYTILEQVPDQEIAHIFNVCNNISRAMFESLNIQGTNIFVQNGLAAGQEEPHFCIHIISRQENDGIKLDWVPKQLTEEEMSTIELQYKQQTEGIVFNNENNTESINENNLDPQNQNNNDKKHNENDDDNYMLKYFNKIP
jgi:diadenosine tetraphosphate (Ap4A) HIT family hydrolase